MSHHSNCCCPKHDELPVNVEKLMERIKKLEAVRKAAIKVVDGELNFHPPALGDLNILRLKIKEAE